MSELITQNTNAMTRKQYWGNMAKAGSVVAIWAVVEFSGIDVSAVAGAGFTPIVGGSVGYWVRDAA
jgi:hypothetical protein